jgi:hypothetical protein
MAPFSTSHRFPRGAKAPARARQTKRKTALRWMLGVCAFALMAGTTRLVGNAFADFGRERAQVRALETSLRAANAAAGANLGPQWQALIDTPAGSRALLGWFEGLDQAWPAMCAAEMLAIEQTAAACLPVPETLAPLVDQRLGAGAYRAMAALRSLPAQDFEPMTAEPFGEEPTISAAPRGSATVRSGASAAPAALPAVLDDGSAFVPPPQPEPADVNDPGPGPDTRSDEASPAPASDPRAAEAVAALTQTAGEADWTVVSPPGFEPGTY